MIRRLVFKYYTLHIRCRMPGLEYRLKDGPTQCTDKNNHFKQIEYSKLPYNNTFMAPLSP
jgi:hypothetical protein